jgi:hypothetical protein
MDIDVGPGTEVAPVTVTAPDFWLRRKRSGGC